MRILIDVEYFFHTGHCHDNRVREFRGPRSKPLTWQCGLSSDLLWGRDCRVIVRHFSTDVKLKRDKDSDKCRCAGSRNEGNKSLERGCVQEDSAIGGRLSVRDYPLSGMALPVNNCDGGNQIRGRFHSYPGPCGSGTVCSDEVSSGYAIGAGVTQR